MVAHVITSSSVTMLSHPRPGSVSAGMNGWFSHASLARSQGLRLPLEGNRPPPFPGKRSQQGCAYRAPGEWADGEQAWRVQLLVTHPYHRGLRVFFSLLRVSSVPRSMPSTQQTPKKCLSNE